MHTLILIVLIIVFAFPVAMNERIEQYFLEQIGNLRGLTLHTDSGAGTSR